MVYAGFEGGVSLSQKNLEQARTKYLLDKLTGKLPPELRGGMGQQLPPINKDSPRGKKGTKSRGSMSVSSKSRAEDQNQRSGTKQEVKIADDKQKDTEEGK